MGCQLRRTACDAVPVASPNCCNFVARPSSERLLRGVRRRTSTCSETRTSSSTTPATAPPSPVSRTACRWCAGPLPAVGDWVAVCDAAGGRYAIEAVLPRRTKISRKTPWLEAEERVLAANVDAVLIVSGLDGDFNPRRLERYLTA